MDRAGRPGCRLLPARRSPRAPAAGWPLAGLACAWLAAGPAPAQETANGATTVPGPSAPVGPSLEAEVERCWREAVESPAGAAVFVEQALAAAPPPNPDPTPSPAPVSAHAAGEAAARGELRLCRGYIREQLGDVAGATQDYAWAVEEGERLVAASAAALAASPESPPAPKRDPRALLAAALAQRGELAYYRGATTAALGDLNRAHALEVELGREQRQRYVLNAIANVYADARVGNYDRALEYYERLRAAHEAAGRRGELATAHFNLGSTLERKGDLEGAVVHLEKAVALDRERGDRDEVAFNERALAAVLVKLGRPRDAIERLDRSLATFTASGNAEWIAFTRLTRGIARRALGELSAALADLDAAAEHFRATDNDRFLVRAEEERAAALEAHGDLAAALAARKRQLALEKGLAEATRDEHTARLRVEFETAQKERDNEALRRENELRSSALRDAERIKNLQRAVLGLAAALLLVLVVLALRQLARARRLHRLAMTDELTRLPNRRAFFAHAEERLAEARRSGTPLAVLAMDIDHFKRINDTHGHEVGDRVLERVAQGARTALRHGDVVGRTGGEEFLAVLPRADGRVAAEVAERLRRAIGGLEVADLAPGLARVTVSVGGAVRLPPAATANAAAGSESVDELVRRADEALYRAKRGGRDRVELDGPAAEAEVEARAATEAETELDLDPEGDAGLDGALASASGRGATLAPGAVIGRYVVLDLIGRGGMGAVYAAYDPQLDRKVAVKVLGAPSAAARAGDLDGDLAGDEVARPAPASASASFTGSVASRRERASARLLREAQALARLQHPHVVAVHDVGTLETRGPSGEREEIFLAMDFIDGETLGRHIARARPSWREVVRLFLDAGRGLVAAHEAGLVHRDFKPSNALVDRQGRVLVLDFGLARAVADADATPGDDIAGEFDDVGATERRGLLATNLTRQGARAGTLGYMAPEQLAGERADPRSDQFAFCAALWEALADGAPPFDGDDAASLLEAMRRAPRPAPAASPVPAGVFALLERGLRWRAEERHPDLGTLLDQLAALSLRRRASDRTESGG